jgi:hypothetical protein
MLVIIASVVTEGQTGTLVSKFRAVLVVVSRLIIHPSGVDDGPPETDARRKREVGEGDG